MIYVKVCILGFEEGTLGSMHAVRQESIFWEHMEMFRHVYANY